MYSKNEQYLPSTDSKTNSPLNKGEDEPVNFLNFICKEVPLDYKLKKYKIKKSPTDPIDFEVDDSHRFRNTVSITKDKKTAFEALNTNPKGFTFKDYRKRRELENEIKKQFQKAFKCKERIEIQPVEVVDWENNIEEFEEDKNVTIIEYVDELIRSNWETNIFIDEETMPAFKNTMTLFLEDPNLIFEKIEDKKIKPKKKNIKFVFSDKPLKNKYNISNDKYYINEIKTKASLDNFGVQHSLPALKLDSRFYKTNHSREELRNFHRAFISFSCERYNFKLPHKSKFSECIIKKGNELTLGDSNKFVICEYMEEFPFFVVNPGMVSLLNTYYRKTDTADELNNDKCICLEPEDEAPFYGFGSIKPGSLLTTFTNNLFISPTFKHKSCDFLCIIENEEIIMRSIENVHLIGQEFPKEEVFAPHSRKLNQFCKDRLKVAAYRLFSRGKDLQMQQLDDMFPYFSEGSKRKWLKEYSDCIKKGKENVWVLKDSFSIVGEEDLRKLVTPENICQYESMLATERRLQDLGYKCSEDDECDEYENFSPSWYLSRNFMNSANGRGLLELANSIEANGDPDCFSFRRVKLKKGNESENRKIIAEHQSTYKETIEKIWNKQISFLGNENIQEQSPAQRSTNEFQPETHPAVETTFLIIKRTFQENGVLAVKTVKITDKSVIKAYLKARKKVKVDDKKSSLTCSSCGQTGHMKTNKTCPNFVGIVKSKKAQEEKKPLEILTDKLQKLTQSFISMPFSAAFHRPVSSKKFPTYKNIIKNPIDLGTIKSKVKNKSYLNFDSYMADIDLMKDNCKLFNGDNHTLTEIAITICDKCREYREENMEALYDLEKGVSDSLK